MATFTTNTTIGSALAPFVGDTRIFAGGYTPGSTPTEYSELGQYAVGNLVFLESSEDIVYRCIVATGGAGNATASTESTRTLVLDNVTGFAHAGQFEYAGGRWQYAGLTEGTGTTGTLFNVHRIEPNNPPANNQFPTVGNSVAPDPTVQYFNPFQDTHWIIDGAYFDDEDVFAANANVAVTANSCTIPCSYLGDGTNSDVVGSFNFNDVTIMANNNSGQRTNSTSWSFDNVTYIDNTLPAGTTTIGKYGGTLNHSTTYNIDGFNVWGNTDGADQAYLAFFPASNGIHQDSVLDNISLWNGETGDDILGGALIFGHSVLSGLVSGPLGYVDVGATARVLYRNAIGPGATDTYGALLSYDYRAIHDTTSQWRFALDFGGNILVVNPLAGIPDGVGRISYATARASHESKAKVYLGHQPIADGDVKFVSREPTADFVTFPDNYNVTGTLTAAGVNTIPAVIDSGIITDISGGAQPSQFGIGFLIQDEVLANGNGASIDQAAETTSNIAAVEPHDVSYQQYSWQHDVWGVTRTITPPTGSVADTQDEVDSLRESGLYPAVNQSGFVTTIDYNGEADILTSDFATVQLARTELYGTTGSPGFVTTGRHVAASLKSVHYDNPDIATTHLDLPYTYSGTTLTFTTDSLILSETAEDAPAVTGTRTVPARNLLVDDDRSVTAISAPAITIVGEILDNESEKVELLGTTFTQGGVITTTTVNVTGTANISDNVNTSNITAGTIALSGGAINGTVLNADNITGHSNARFGDNVSLIGDTTITTTETGVATPEQLFGDGFVPGDTVTITKTGAALVVNISAADNAAGRYIGTGSVTIRVEDIVVRVDARALNNDVYYTWIIETGTPTAPAAGTVASGAFLDIPIEEINLSAGESIKLVVVGADTPAVITDAFTHADGDQTIIASLDTLYNNESKPASTDVSAEINSAEFTILVPAGSTELETGRLHNAVVGGLKSDSVAGPLFATFLASRDDTSYDITYHSQTGVNYTNTGTTGHAIEIVPGDSASDVGVQGAVFRTALTGAGSDFVTYVSDETGFEDSIVTDLAITGATVGGTLLNPQPVVSTRVILDTSIDYTSVELAVNAAVGDELAVIDSNIDDTRAVAGWLTESKGGIRGRYNPDDAADYVNNL